MHADAVGAHSCEDDSTDKGFLSKALKNLLTVHVVGQRMEQSLKLPVT